MPERKEETTTVLFEFRYYMNADTKQVQSREEATLAGGLVIDKYNSNFGLLVPVEDVPESVQPGQQVDIQVSANYGF